MSTKRERRIFKEALRKQGVLTKFKQHLRKYYDGEETLKDFNVIQGDATISRAFYWRSTPEGHDFWHKVSFETQRLIDIRLSK